MARLTGGASTTSPPVSTLLTLRRRRQGDLEFARLLENHRDTLVIDAGAASGGAGGGILVQGGDGLAAVAQLGAVRTDACDVQSSERSYQATARPKSATVRCTAPRRRAAGDQS